MHVAKRRAVTITVGLGLFVMIIAQMIPFYIALTTAGKPKSDLSPQWTLPTQLYVDNFVAAMTSGHIGRAVFNSIVVTGISVFLVCLLGALAAYPLARRSTLINKIVLAFMLSLLMIPPLSILVPLYTMLSHLGAINTYWGIILVMVAQELPLSIFLYTAFVRSVPISLEDAARIDGANVVQTFFRIVLPLLKPVTATVLILTGVHIWNEYALSVFLLTDPAVQTIAPTIGAFFSQQTSNLGAAAAASLMGVIPILIAYLFLQKYFVKGMVAGAEK